MIFKSQLIILSCLALLLSGCNDNLTDDLSGLADAQSLARYKTLPADSGLLLCLQSDGVLGKLPQLGAEGRQIGRFGPSTLVVVGREKVPALAEVKGLKAMVLWGDDKAAGKLDPMLKEDLLSSMATSDWREKEHRLIGSFDKDTVDLKEALTNAGARVSSAAGGVVTFRAPAEIIFDILAWDNLRQLKTPNFQRPTQSLK